MRMLRSLFLACLFVSGVASAQGAVPTVVNFSARLTDSGAPVTAQRNFVFKLFLTPMGGSELWTETRNMLSVTNGTLNVDLGASTPLTDTILDGRALYLEVTVDGTVLTPRMQLASVPYALRSTVTNRIGALTETDLQRRVGSTCPSGSAIRVINADGTVTCQAAATVADAGVTITSVNSGPGLTGGGATGDLTLGVAFAGSGSANTVSRSDHTHGGFLPLGNTLACPAGERVLRIDAATGNVICSGVGSVTSVVAGTGLTGGTITSSGTIGLASSVQNWASQPTCAPGSALRTVSSTGVATCESVPAPLTPAPNGGLTVNSGNIGLVSVGCPANAVMRLGGSGWACSPDVQSVTAASGSAVVVGGTAANPTIGLAATVPNFTTPPACPPGQALRAIANNGTPTCAPAGPPSWASVWFPQCTGSSCSAGGGYVYGSNVAAGQPTITRSSAGVYQVGIPWVNQGAPTVSAYSTNALCRIGGWSDSPLSASVICVNPATGAQIDSAFNFSVMGP